MVGEAGHGRTVGSVGESGGVWGKLKERNFRKKITFESSKVWREGFTLLSYQLTKCPHYPVGW